MIRTPHRIRKFLVIGALAAMAAGCGDSGATPTPVGDGALDQQVVERLLTKSDIGDAGGDTGGLDRTVENIFAVASAAGREQVDGVEDWYSAWFMGTGRPGLLLTVKRYEDVAGALAALDSVEAGGAYASMADAVGDRSALSPVNPAIGAAMAFVDGRTLVSLQLPAASDGATLLDDVQLVALAELVERRL